MIASSKIIEHFEIAAYGILAAFAKILFKKDAEKLLNHAPAEEKEADCLLNNVALNAVDNTAAE
ncbi:DUF892 family protein [Flavobacterium chungbukense]|uniref:DUF892 family protein n=1 Tax=Flavobacterium chungbukense TaxID=877464 RepID=UPI00374D0DF3|nr:DUF892 family protein [Flavobacterium chungbukense]